MRSPRAITTSAGRTTRDGTDGSATAASARTQHIRTLSSYLALVYHEGRNVRHLIRADGVPSEPWERLRSLPTKREDAWAAIQQVRAAASAATSAGDAAWVFAKRFAADLDAMVALYDHAAWKNAKIGGNRWADISRAVRGLRDALDAGNEQEVSRLLAALVSMRHNTGGVEEKLARLDRLLETQRGG